MSIQKEEASSSSMLFMFIAAIGLALAPFRPEPHLFGKIRWVMGGAEGMGAKDWFDLLMHGLPITLVTLWALWKFVAKLRSQSPTQL